MFSLQQASMDAAEAIDDLSVAAAVVDFTERRKSTNEKKLVQDSKMVAEKPMSYKAHIEQSKYVPPVPTPVQPKEEEDVDLSLVQLGSQVRHKAFGVGTVKAISDGLIVVAFGRSEKKFLFPGAFVQGFLSLTE